MSYIAVFYIYNIYLYTVYCKYDYVLYCFVVFACFDVFIFEAGLVLLSSFPLFAQKHASPYLFHVCTGAVPPNHPQFLFIERGQCTVYIYLSIFIYIYIAAAPQLSPFVVLRKVAEDEDLLAPGSQVTILRRSQRLSMDEMVRELLRPWVWSASKRKYQGGHLKLGPRNFVQRVTDHDVLDRTIGHKQELQVFLSGLVVIPGTPNTHYSIHW